MTELINFPVCAQTLQEYDGTEDLIKSCRALGCGGIEAVWGGDETVASLPEGSAVGYHLLFYPDWLDFWRGDEDALLRKFGSKAAWIAFYGGNSRDCLLEQYRLDLERAARLGAKYVVFHVSDISIDEGYTYRWLHSCEEVIDASAELLNELTDGRDYPFAILMENQWWPGFTFTEPKLTARLLDAVRYPDRGLLLDTGHLLNANTALRTESEGIAYIRKMLEQHGQLAQSIRAVHLHKSLSGAYVRAHTGFLPENLPEEYGARFAQSYGHVLQIDRHEPWTQPQIADLISRIEPRYLTHELAANSRAERERAVKIQRETLLKGEISIWKQNRPTVSAT